MKKFKFQLLIPGFLTLLVLVYACGQSFLNKPPLGTLSPAIVANKAGVQGLLIGAYSMLDGNGGNEGPAGGWGGAASNWVYGSVCADDAYKGSTPSDQGDILPLEQWQGLPNNSYPGSKWTICYDGANRSNDVLRNMRLATDISAADTAVMSGEARFLRAFYHFELKKVFGNVPYVDESITVSAGNYNVPNVDGTGNYVNIYPQIEADLTYAVANLPDVQPNKGRVNKSAANAFLAKVFMYEHNYAGAKAIFDALITGGKTASGTAYKLQTNFQNNFNPDASAKNSSESAFAAEMSVNDGSGAVGNGGNGNYGDALNFPYGGGPGVCCGFDNPSQDLANAYKTDATGLPLMNTFQTAGGSVSDQTPGAYAGNLDPRIDWTIGRKGIPYLDGGLHPGDAWIRSPGDDGHVSPKQNVYAKSQQGTYSDTENYWANVELTSNNVNLMRFADILLMDAECEVEIGSLDQAQTYVNMIRTRAGAATGQVYTDGSFDAPSYTYKGGTIPADKYKVAPWPAAAFTTGGQAFARQAVQFERRLELAEEGHRFFDLQRWDNGTGTMATVLNTYAGNEAVIHPGEYAGVHFTQGRNEHFAIPQGEIDSENSTGKINLKQNPGY